jgi:hypothetical protein
MGGSSGRYARGPDGIIMWLVEELGWNDTSSIAITT